jgi:hypothetical protein
VILWKSEKLQSEYSSIFLNMAMSVIDTGAHRLMALANALYA